MTTNIEYETCWPLWLLKIYKWPTFLPLQFEAGWPGNGKDDWNLTDLRPAYNLNHHKLIEFFEPIYKYWLQINWLETTSRTENHKLKLMRTKQPWEIYMDM
jgi:hypothetical protein